MAEQSILDRLSVTPEEFMAVIEEHPGLQGLLIKYLVEEKFKKIHLSDKNISRVTKHDNYNNKKKGDLAVVYKDVEFIICLKALQPNKVQETTQGWVGKVPFDSKERREVLLPNGRRVKTTCFLKSEFDIIATGFFTFENTLRFVFAKSSDLPSSNYHNYTKPQRRFLLPTSITVSWPPKPPFTEDLISLMDDIVEAQI